MKYISQKELEKKLKPIDFKSLISKETNGRLRIRLLAMSHIRNGADRTKTAKHLKVNRRMVNDWAKRFFNEGLDGLKEKPRTGRPKKLTEEQLIKFTQYVKTEAVKPKGGRLNGHDYADYIDEQFSVRYTVQNVYLLLHQLNFSWITSRSRHPKPSEEIQDDFKKIPK
jgi:transposase